MPLERFSANQQEFRGVEKKMQLIKQLYAVDEQHQIHTVAVYKQALGSHIYRLDDRETVEPLDEKWFVTLAGDVLERVAPPADSPHAEINV